MELLELTKIMFEDPQTYQSVTPGEKRKHFFMINRRMAINYPLRAQALQHLKIDEVAVIDVWQRILRRTYTITPKWMYTSGVKKVKEEKEKKLTIKDSTIKEYAIRHGYDIKSVREALMFFPEEMKKELQSFEKMLSE